MMSRKRKMDEPGMNGAATAIADPPAHVQPSPVQPAAAQVSPTTSKPKPVAGFAANSDRTTRVEVAVWARQVKSSDGEEYTQYSLSLNRSWRDKEGNWIESGYYRAHDVPVLLYLIQQAHHWCINRRMTYRTELDDELPF